MAHIAFVESAVHSMRVMMTQASIAAMPVTSQIASGESKSHMTHKQLEREFGYRVIMALINELLTSRVVSETEYCMIKTKMIMRFQPILAGLYP